MRALEYPAGVYAIAVAQFLAAAELFGVLPFSGSINDILVQLMGVGDILGLGEKPALPSGLLIVLLSPLWGAFVVSGLGLLSGKRWSWTLSMTLSKFWGSGNLVWLIFYAGLGARFHSLPGFAQISAAPFFINAVMAGLSVWYLMREEVRQAFGQ